MWSVFHLYFQSSRVFTLKWQKHLNASKVTSSEYTTTALDLHVTLLMYISWCIWDINGILYLVLLYPALLCMPPYQTWCKLLNLLLLSPHPGMHHHLLKVRIRLAWYFFIKKMNVCILLFLGQNTSHKPGIGLTNNPAYSLCLPKSHLAANPSTLRELEYNMENNPLYTRMEMFTKPYGTDTSPVHHYEYVAVGNV